MGWNLSFRGDFFAMLRFRFFDLAGFVIDHAELAGFAVAVDPVDGAVDFETCGVEGDFAFRIDDLPAFGHALHLLGNEPCEALAYRVDLDAHGERGMISKLSENGAVERSIEIGEEGFWIRKFTGFGILAPDF